MVEMWPCRIHVNYLHIECLLICLRLWFGAILVICGVLFSRLICEIIQCANVAGQFREGLKYPLHTVRCRKSVHFRPHQLPCTLRYIFIYISCADTDIVVECFINAQHRNNAVMFVYEWVKIGTLHGHAANGVSIALWFTSKLTNCSSNQMQQTQWTLPRFPECASLEWID